MYDRQPTMIGLGTERKDLPCMDPAYLCPIVLAEDGIDSCLQPIV